MKVIKYNLCIKVNDGTEEILTPVTMGWNEANEEIAKHEAHNGEYTIEDDGQPEPESVKTDSERIKELEEALALLLSGAVE
jgi:hypothetical protein